jgi:hypothetical protein
MMRACRAALTRQGSGLWHQQAPAHPVLPPAPTVLGSEAQAGTTRLLHRNLNWSSWCSLFCRLAKLQAATQCVGGCFPLVANLRVKVCG